MVGTLALERNFWGTGGNVTMLYLNTKPGRVKSDRAMDGVMWHLGWMSIRAFVETLREHETIIYSECVMSDVDMKTLKAHDVMRSL